MAETKRVSDQYTISAPTIVIDGNLTILGSSTSVETTDSFITDNIIELNKGETGAGVGNGIGFSGIEIDRGTLPPVTLRWNESSLQWQITVDGTNYSNITTGGITGAAGVDTSVQFNTTGSFNGDANFTYDGFNVNIGDTTINSGSIFTNSSNSDLEIYASGTGTIHIRSVVKLENEISDPSSVAGTNQIYAKTPDGGGTGLYFVNSTASGEMVSKSKAIVFGIIF
jgi:hypothetical protein